MSDLRGAARLAVDATAGVTEIVEEMHASIARIPTTLGGPIGAVVNGITWLVYRTIHGVTRATGGGLDVALARLPPAVARESSPRREAFLAALNGVVGDHLAATENPLAIAMSFRVQGRPLVLERDALATALPAATGKILLLVHGLCMNDLQWTRPRHDHGAALARALGYPAVHLHYNTGRHVSTNGRELAGMLDALIAAWPVPVDELTIVGHSMGGLVARSAQHYAAVAGRRWPHLLRNLVFLGTPHHGAPLERGGHRLHLFVEKTPYAAPLARLGRIRSAGITDLRWGNLVDEDWDGRDRFARGEDGRRPVPLPDGVRCFTVAATRGTSADGIVGDGLVPVASALGRHVDARHVLGFPPSHAHVASGTGHLELLERPDLSHRIASWLR